MKRETTDIGAVTVVDRKFCIWCGVDLTSHFNIEYHAENECPFFRVLTRRMVEGTNK